jgi:hypothetical protein
MGRKRPRLGRPVDQKGRSKGEGQFVLLPYALLQSLAWRSLSGPSVKVFLELRTRFHGANNGRLIFSLEEGKRLLGLGKATVQRALVELQDKGLIACTRKGQWYGRLASTWATTDKSVNGAPATNEWRMWRPNPATIRSRQKTERGPITVPSAQLMGPLQDRGPIDGTATGPVSTIRLVATGSGMGR